MVTDLTAQKVHQRVSADEVLARSILEQAAEAIVVCDGGGIIRRASGAAARLCGSDPILRPFLAAFPIRGPEPDPSEVEPVPMATEADVADFWSRPIEGREFRMTRRDGVRFDLLLTSGPVVDRLGGPLGRVVTLTDITPIKAMEEELRRRAADLAEADRRKDEFLAMLAHELRNPLAAISTAAALTTREGTGADVAWSIEVIGRQIRHLTRLIDDLLDVSRITRGKIRLQTDRIDPAPIVAAAVETVRPLVEARGHDLSVAFESDDIRVVADPTRLEQILVNLLANAAKYTESGGTIRLSVGREAALSPSGSSTTGSGSPATSCRTSSTSSPRGTGG